MNKLPLVNVVIRTFNEEDWIKFCLIKILEQNYDNFIITVVDSGSSDATLNIVNQYIKANPNLILLRNIEDFKPGKAINIGADSIDSDYFICLSAHCIPQNQNFISSYVNFMEDKKDVVGAYGRQLPLASTHPDDARDMLITFGAEQRVINKDHFFHNANSIIRTKFWNQYPFDEKVPHVEDQVWAKKVIEMKYKTAYIPQSAVYHYHGLHQHGKSKSFRAVSVLKVMHSLNDKKAPTEIKSIIGKNIDMPLVIIIPRGDELKENTINKINLLFNEYKDHNRIFIVSDSRIKNLNETIIYIDRSTVDNKENISLRDFMRNILLKIEKNLSSIVDGLIFYDLGYRDINVSLGKKCQEITFSQWHSSVMPAWKDFGNYWIQNDEGFENIHSSFDLREEKPALYRSILGQGGAVRASAIRSRIKEIPVGEVIWTEDTSILAKE